MVKIKEEKILNLINSVRAQPAIWDLKAPDYLDTAKKKRIFEGIATDVGFSGNFKKLSCIFYFYLY